jgi:hypothetical protein
LQDDCFEEEKSGNCDLNVNVVKSRSHDRRPDRLTECSHTRNNQPSMKTPTKHCVDAHTDKETVHTIDRSTSTDVA